MCLIGLLQAVYFKSYALFQRAKVSEVSADNIRIVPSPPQNMAAATTRGYQTRRRPCVIRPGGVGKKGSPACAMHALGVQT